MCPAPAVRNPFDHPDAAQRYTDGRPAFHPLVLARLAPHIAGQALGADVACGTGLSSVALAELVDEVRAFELSEAMLAHALPHPRVSYAQAPAEALPLPDGVLDVLTVAQAFHWFERDAFLHGARRTLKPDGVLALYDDFFLGEMEGEPDFAAFAQRYMARYPTPPRHRDPFGAPEARTAGFAFQEERWRHTLPMTQPQLVAYLLTHSNTLAATESGQTTREDITAWLLGELAPFYREAEVRNVHFGAWLAVLEPLG